MKLLSCFVAIMAIVGACSRSVDSAFQDAKTQLAIGDTLEAIASLEKAIGGLSRSEEKDSSYVTLFFLLQNRRDRLAEEWTKSRSQGRTDLPRGSIRINLGNGIEWEEYLAIREKLKSAAEKYLLEYPSGPLGDQAKRVLFSVYADDSRDLDRNRRFCMSLLGSTDRTLFRSSRYYLARVAHGTHRYDEAITYYEQLAESPITSDERAKYLLYMADCYYNLGNVQQALRNLDLVEETEQGGPGFFTEKYVPIWRQAYGDSMRSKRHTFMHFVFR